MSAVLLLEKGVPLKTIEIFRKLARLAESSGMSNIQALGDKACIYFVLFISYFLDETTVHAHDFRVKSSLFLRFA